MGIVSSEVLINRSDSNDSVFIRRIRELHTDHLGKEIPKTYDNTFITDPADYTVDDVLDEDAYNAALAEELLPITQANAVDIDAQSAEQEIQIWIQEMGQGLDPWHITPYNNVTPEYNDWETAASESLKYWLLMPDRQQLLNCDLSVNSTSNKDLDDLLELCGSTFNSNDLRGEIQQAIDTQVELDTYSPSVVE